MSIKSRLSYSFSSGSFIYFIDQSLQHFAGPHFCEAVTSIGDHGLNALRPANCAGELIDQDFS